MKAALARLGLVVGGLGAGLLLAEGGSRLLGASGDAELFYAAPESVPEGFYVTDRELLMVPAADFEGQARTLDGQVTLRTNAFRLRGPPVAPSDRPRWLAVGDSFTLGVQVEEHETFAARLSEAADLDVLNAGVDGFSTWQAAGRYARLAPGLDPDGALLTLFLGNDLHDNASFPGRLASAKGMVPGRAIPRPAVPPATRVLMRTSHLYARYRVWRRSRSASEMAGQHRARWRDELSIFHAEGAERLAALVEETAPALRQLADAADSQGDRLVVALAPPAFAVDEDRLAPTFSAVGLDPAGAHVTAPAEAVAAALGELGVSGCDLRPALVAAEGTGGALYFAWDGHWTPRGHAVVAEALATCLEAR